MSKFQSFATQGSFRDYQLQAPDETAKIEQETARTIRGRERAQQFLEQNNELYLRAQKLAQNQESAQREQNFQLETENRKAFRDALDRDYRIQTENDRVRAAQTEQTYKQLSAFSKTAFELYGQVNQQITETQEKANAANTIIAGTTVQENIAIKGMVSNLTRAEFEQQDLITNLVKEGKDVDALWALYGRRNTRGFINNISTIQNTANGLDSYLNQTILNLPEGLTAEQQKIEVEKAYRTFVADNFTVGGKQLNPKLINNVAAPILNSAYNRVSGEFDREIKKERLEKLRQDKLEGLNVLWDSGGGVQGLLTQYHTVNPSQEKREIFAEWIVSRLKAGTLTPEEATAMLDTEYDGPNGQPTTWRKQFSASKEVGIVNEAIRDQRRVNVGEVALRESELKIAVDDELKQKVDEFVVDGDGSLSPEELAVLEDIQSKGPVGYESPVLEEARKFTVEYRTAQALEKQWEKKLNEGTLTTADILAVKGNFKLTQEWLAKAVALEKLRDTPESKTDINAIKAKIAQDPRIKAAPVTGAENYSVILMQERFVRMYKATLQRTNSPAEARAITLAAIENLQSNPKAVTNGFYTEIVQQEKAGAISAKTSLKEYQEFLQLAAKPSFRKDPKAAVNAVGAYNFKTGYDAITQGREPPTIIKKGAELMGVTPLEFMNFLVRGAGAGWEPITVDDQLKEIQKTLKPVTQRLYNVTRTNDRIIRASIIDSSGLSTAPRRGSFGPSQSSTLNDPVLRRAADITSNYESAGAGGYNAVNQGGEAGGTRIPKGFYSGDFRAMAQHKGRALTDLTIGEIMDLQADPGGSRMSNAEWVRLGKLHAVGRYQFIGPTLRGLVQRLGISRSAKFTPELQDRLFLSLLKSGGPGQWVGLRNATAQEMAIIRQAQSKL
jgi:hypothetical protein